MAIAFPPYQELQCPAPYLTVDHFFNLIPLLPSYTFRWWWWWWVWSSTYDRIWWGRHEFDNMEDWVKL